MTNSQSATSSHADRSALAWLVLVLSITQAAVSPIVQAISGDTPGEQGDDLLITPPGWAFSIWGVIYFLAIAHAILTLVRGTATTASRGLLTGLAIVYAGSTAWILASAYGNSWLTFVVLVVIASAAIWSALVLMRNDLRDGAPAWHEILEIITVGLYGGWVSMAAYLNLGTALELGSDEQPQWILVLAAIGTALAVLWLVRANLGYAAAVVWALAGITIAAWSDSSLIGVTGLVGIGAVLAVTAVRAARTKSIPD